MIDWIDEKLRAWGRAKWRIVNSDEYPPSIFGRIQDYGLATSDHTRLEQFREGMTGDALDASVAIHRAMMAGMLTDKQYEAVFIKYAYPGPRAGGLTEGEKARRLGYNNRQAYYQMVDRAQANLKDFFW